MDHFQAPDADKTLTLAFEKAATQNTSVFHPMRYFIAGGETLAKIEQFIADVANVEQATAALCAKVGAKSFNGVYGFTFDYNYADLQPPTGKERTDYQMQGGAGHDAWQSKILPSMPDFVFADGRASGQVHPNVATERGREIRDETMVINEMSKPALRFAKWLGAADIDVPVNGNYPNGAKVKMSATATKIGNDWVVAVPVEVKYSYTDQKTTEQWIVPPGATPLAISDYFARVEKANLIKNTGPAAGK